MSKPRKFKLMPVARGAPLNPPLRSLVARQVGMRACAPDTVLHKYLGVTVTSLKGETMINHPNRKKIENTLFPGRDNYTGPTKGWFAFLHHKQLCEESHDVNERLDYVKREKPKNEVVIRLHNMIYLGGCEVIVKHALLDADHKAKCALLGADFEAKRVPLDADFEAKCALLCAEYAAKRAPLDADYAAKHALLDADFEAKRAPLDAGYRAKRALLHADYAVKRALLCADYAAKRAPLYAEILAYIKSNIPDCAWDGETLVFTEYE